MANYLVCVDGNREKLIQNLSMGYSSLVGKCAFLVSDISSEEFERKICRYRLKPDSEKFIYVRLFYSRDVPISNDKIQITNFDTNINELMFKLSK